MKCDDRPQLLAAASVNLILTHFAFPRGKNLRIFVFKIRFEIFLIAATIYLTGIYASEIRKMGPTDVSAGPVIGYRTKY